MDMSAIDMMPQAEEATRLMKALAHPERLMICCQLREGELSVGEIETTLSIPQPRLSRELGQITRARHFGNAAGIQVNRLSSQR